MPTYPVPIAFVAAVALAGGMAACGDSGGGATATTSTAPAAGATFRFRDGALVPPVVRIPRGAGRVRVTVVSEDGRPHGVVVKGGRLRTRIVVGAGATQTRTIEAAPGRYQVAPDGAADPAELIVG